MHITAGVYVNDNESGLIEDIYQRAVGYNYEQTKVFMPANREKPVYASTCIQT